MSENGQVVALRQEIDSIRPRFQAVAVDKTVNFEAEAGFAMQVLTANDYAMKTALMNRQSVINAVTNVAAIGVSLNPAKRQAYLVPRDGRICLDISYMGLLDLAIQSGSLKWGQAELVMAEDRFELNGFDKPPLHTRDPFKADRGAIIGAYVVVKTLDGDYLTTTMTSDEILAIRDRSSAWKAWVEKKARSPGPWGTDPGEMMKKTVIKRAYKTWPKTDKLDAAVHYLNNEEGEGLPPIENLDPVEQPKNFGLTPQRAAIIRAVAGAALQHFNEGDEFGAFAECAEITDNEERLALWSVLKPHSALRSSLKRLGEEQRKRDAELAVMKAPPAIPADEQTAA